MYKGETLYLGGNDSQNEYYFSANTNTGGVASQPQKYYQGVCVNKTTKEEFRISSWFRFANAGIQEVIDNGSGKPVITYDDDTENLNGVEINVLFYRENTGDGEYARIWREPAPVVMDTDQLSYTEKDVSFWKTRSERGLSSWQQARNGESETSVEAVVQSITDAPDDAPF